MSETLADPRILVVGAGALSVVGTVLVGASGGTVPTVVGGFAWVCSGVLAKLAYDVKRGETA